MASVTGSRLAFFDGNNKAVNIVLTADGNTGTVVGSGATGAIGSLASGTATNIEVFTTAAGSANASYQISAFIQGAVQFFAGDTSEIQAASLASTEQLLTGSNYVLV